MKSTITLKVCVAIVPRFQRIDNRRRLFFIIRLCTFDLMDFENDTSTTVSFAYGLRVLSIYMFAIYIIARLLLWILSRKTIYDLIILVCLRASVKKMILIHFVVTYIF